jgi:hypothetical protein
MPSQLDDGSFIAVVTDKAAYSAGEVVTGKVRSLWVKGCVT